MATLAPRPYHSASSIKLGMTCEHAWFLEYRLGLRLPSVPWEVIESWEAQGNNAKTPESPYVNAQRSFSLGTAMHAVVEDYYLGKVPEFHNLPGQMASILLDHAPNRDALDTVWVEDSIGRLDISGRPGTHAHSPPTGMMVHGVMFAGYVDLVVYDNGDELTRLGIHAPDGVALLDWKSSSNIKKYALTPEALHLDVQANIYGLDTCIKHNIDSVPARWVYSASKKTRKGSPTDTVIIKDTAIELLVEPARVARHLDTIQTIQDAKQNPLACDDYAGCRHHFTKGGTCHPKRSMGLRASLLKKKDTEIMAMSPAMQKRFNAEQAKKKAALDAAPSAEELREFKEESLPEVAAEEPAKPARARRPRTPPKDTAPAEAEPCEPPAEPPAKPAPRAKRGKKVATQAEQLSDLADELQGLDVKRTAVLDSMRELLAAN